MVCTHSWAGVRVHLAMSGFVIPGFLASHHWISLTIRYPFLKGAPFMLTRAERLWEHCRVESPIYPKVKDDCKHVVQLRYLSPYRCRGKRMEGKRHFSQSRISAFLSEGSRRTILNRIVRSISEARFLQLHPMQSVSLKRLVNVDVSVQPHFPFQPRCKLKSIFNW